MNNTHQNILLIMPRFFGYEKAMVYHLRQCYQNVYFRTEIPLNNKIIFHTFRNISRKITDWLEKRYAEKLVTLIKKKEITRIFIIRGECIDELFFQKLQQINPDVDIVHYQWDSIKNNPNALVIKKYTINNFSFDKKDCQTYPEFAYLPLFYFWDGINTHAVLSEKPDLLFIGGFHSNRYEVIQKIKQECLTSRLHFQCHLYIPFAVYIKIFFTGKRVPKLKEISFRKISRQKLYNYMSATKAVLDVASPTQSGATMRTIETLSLKKKVISTNTNLAQESFYDSRNIQLLDKFRIKDFETFANQPFDTSKNKFVLHISQWLDYMGL